MLYALPRTQALWPGVLSSSARPGASRLRSQPRNVRHVFRRRPVNQDRCNASSTTTKDPPADPALERVAWPSELKARMGMLGKGVRGSSCSIRSGLRAFATASRCGSGSRSFHEAAMGRNNCTANSTNAPSIIGRNGARWGSLKRSLELRVPQQQPRQQRRSYCSDDGFGGGKPFPHSDQVDLINWPGGGYNGWFVQYVGCMGLNRC